MNAEIKLAQFEGPFDLLLNLIGEEKLDICEVSLSQVMEQFLAYIDKLEKDKAEELADFLLVAAKLMYLKSRLLLPQFSDQEDEDGPSLEDQLKLYQAFIELSKRLNDKWLSEQVCFFRVNPIQIPDKFIPPKNLYTENLVESMENLINRVKPPKPLPQAEIDKAISIKSRIDVIRSVLRSKAKFNFSDIIGCTNNKTEVIVGFLALLELVKQKSVSLQQDKLFSDIMIKKYEINY